MTETDKMAKNLGNCDFSVLYAEKMMEWFFDAANECLGSWATVESSFSPQAPFFVRPDAANKTELL